MQTRVVDGRHLWNVDEFAKQRYYDALADMEGELVETFSRVVDDRSPSWEQYKYLFGHVYKVVVDDYHGRVTTGELMELHHQMMVKHNGKRTVMRDRETGKIITEDDGQAVEILIPGSVSLRSGISMRKLSKITESVKSEFEQMGFVFAAMGEWDGDVDPALMPSFIW